MKHTHHAIITDTPDYLRATECSNCGHGLTSAELKARTCAKCADAIARAKQLREAKARQ